MILGKFNKTLVTHPHPWEVNSIDKAQKREEIKQQVAEYLARGGQIHLYDIFCRPDKFGLIKNEKKKG